MISKKNSAVLVLCIVSAFLIDQISKVLIVSTLTPFEPPVNVIGTLLRFKLTYNPYGVFSISFGPNVLYYVLSIVGIVFLTIVGLSLKDKTGVVVFGIIIGGALGNIFDRVRLDYVIDFIDMGFGSLRWFTYNLADAFITVGAILLLVREVFFRKRATSVTSQATSHK
jgi:signal peptidase II